MPSQPSENQELRIKASLLDEVIELLIGELFIISNRKWEELPDLKKRKVVLASRLREIDWTRSPRSVDWLQFKSQISDLEDQSRQKIQVQLDLIGHQILAMQELHLYVLECLNVSFRKFYEPIPPS